MVHIDLEETTLGRREDDIVRPEEIGLWILGVAVGWCMAEPRQFPTIIQIREVVSGPQCLAQRRLARFETRLVDDDLRVGEQGVAHDFLSRHDLHGLLQLDALGAGRRMRDHPHFGPAFRQSAGLEPSTAEVSVFDQLRPRGRHDLCVGSRQPPCLLMGLGRREQQLRFMLGQVRRLGVPRLGKCRDRRPAALGPRSQMASDVPALQDIALGRRLRLVRKEPGHVECGSKAFGQRRAWARADVAGRCPREAAQRSIGRLHVCVAARCVFTLPLSREEARAAGCPHEHGESVALAPSTLVGLRRHEAAHSHLLHDPAVPVHGLFKGQPQIGAHAWVLEDVLDHKDGGGHRLPVQTPGKALRASVQALPVVGPVLEGEQRSAW